MKNKRILIGIIVLVIILITCGLLFIFLKPDKKESKKPMEKKIDFSEVYTIQNQTYNNTENGFNLSVDIVNKTKEEQRIECIKININNYDDKTLLSSEEYINATIQKNESYNYILRDYNAIDLEQIKEVKYDLCS